MRPLKITLRQGVLLAMVVVSLYPAWFVIQTALKTNIAYTLSPTGLPTHPTLENLRRVLFDLPPDRRLPAAMQLLGIDFSRLSEDVGHA